MKSLVFIPFAFIAGDQGFALFAPYLTLMFVILLLVRRRNHPTAATGAGHG